MKQYISRYIENLRQKTYLGQIFTFYWWTFLVLIPAMPIMALLNHTIGENDAGPDIENRLGVLFFVNIIVPIIETFLYQHGIYWLMQKLPFTQGRKVLYIIVSSSIFGLSHWYSIQYIVFATFTGFVLGTTYLFYEDDKEASFWSTTLVHALKNTTATIFAFYIFPQA